MSGGFTEVPPKLLQLLASNHVTCNYLHSVHFLHCKECLNKPRMARVGVARMAQNNRKMKLTVLFQKIVL